MRASRLVVVIALVTGVLAVVQSGGGAQTPRCFGRAATHVVQPGVPLVGTSGADVIVGTSGDDLIRGRGGEDRICAKGGDDRVWGNGGDDRIKLGSGDDWAKGGKGDDRIWGNKGRDIAWGNGGQDTLNGGSGFDMLMGGKKADEVLGKAGADALEGNGGNDRLAGGKGIDACNGGTGTNTLSSCNEDVPFGPNPFIGWWRLVGDANQFTVTIDPAGNLNALVSLSTGFCPAQGLPMAAAEFSFRGVQTDPTTWQGGGVDEITCRPHDGSPAQTFPANFHGLDVLDFDTATDTFNAGEACYWRRFSSEADCQ